MKIKSLLILLSTLLFQAGLLAQESDSECSELEGVGTYLEVSDKYEWSGSETFVKFKPNQITTISKLEAVSFKTPQGYLIERSANNQKRSIDLGNNIAYIEKTCKKNKVKYASYTPEPFVWDIKEETKLINGYNCQLATTTTMLGELTTAWFTPDVKTFAGPSGFWGLPGIIVALEIEGNPYRYELINVEYTKVGDITPNTGKKVERKEVDSYYVYAMNNKKSSKLAKAQNKN